MPRIPVGIQLYTVRDDCAKDFRGTIKALAEMGYEGVELAGDGRLTAPDLKTLFADHNLRIAGSHSSLDDLRGDLDKVIDFSLTIGNQRVVCPWLPQEYQEKGAAGYREAARILDDIGAKLAEKNLSLSYHNHSFEFAGKEGGEYFLDILYANSAPAHLKAEIDTYWIQHGGADPIAYLKRYAGRIELLHIKDMSVDSSRTFAEIGAGILNWEGIFTAASEAGVAWYLVEQDTCPGPPLESARKSLAYLSSRGMLPHKS
jgi:sugar phosphate isomerase/epimerase